MAMKERRLGQTRHNSYRLLNTVNGKSRCDADAKRPVGRAGGAIELDIDAPPLSSDEEEEESLSRAGDLKPSRFGKGGGDGGRRPRRRQQQPELMSSTEARDGSSSPRSPSRGEGRDEKWQPSGSVVDGLGSQHVESSWSSQASKKAKRSTYGSQPKARPAKARGVGRREEEGEASPRKKFKEPVTIPSNSDPETPPRPFKLTTVDDSSDVESAERPSFRDPMQDFMIADGPASTPRRSFKHPMTISPFKGQDDSPRRDFKLPVQASPLKEDEEPAFNIPSILGRRAAPDAELPDLRDIGSPVLRNNTIKRSYADMSQLHSKIDLDAMVEEVLQYGALNHPTPSSLEALDSLDLERTTGHLPPAEAAPHALCPMCGDDVDADLLRRHSGGARMNIRLQERFCRAHKRQAARAEWTARGYPRIDWEGLDQRIRQHHDFLKKILDGGASYYKNVLQEHVRSGKNRTLLQGLLTSPAAAAAASSPSSSSFSSEPTLTPGYYGPRGLRAMSENIMARFSPQLRRIAVTDRLVSARGVTAYVEAVLVPELAARLIAEDLCLAGPADDVRAVMRDSVALGDLLNDELEDVVVAPPSHHDQYSDDEALYA
ncbi:MAG: hypothetical protein M1818_008093 [Claussenomyces sp. TS43310]|nr:MAG: hypothetical protein M1818_008093 [Claussenomyces sp. TS43310]